MTAPGPRSIRAGALVQTAAALLWLPQAAAIAAAAQLMADGGNRGSLPLLAAAVLLVGLARTALDAWGARAVFAAARAAVSALRTQALDRLLAGSALDATRPLAGQAASTLAEQADAVLASLVRFEPARLRATIVPIAIIAAIAPLSWLAAVALLLAAPLIPLFMALIGWRAQAASEAQMLELGGMNGFLLDRLRGLASIRALHAVDATAARLAGQAQDLRRRSMAVLRIAFLSSTALELFSALGVALVAVYIGFHLLGTLGFGAWGARLTLGQGLFILLLAPAFFEPLRDLSAAWHDRAAGRAALGALQRLARPRTPVSPIRQDDGQAAVVLRDVTFGHADAPAPVISGLSLAIDAGEHVALVAPSGAGKSTLLALVAGLATPQAGSVHGGGAGAGWLGASPWFIAGSLRANVRMDRPQVTVAMADRALALVGLDDPGRIIGESGAGLSGGEAARVALARAVADPAARVILADEPTAHLDSATAAAVIQRLVDLCQDRTLLLATHDPAVAALMDRVVRL